ncbi:hypothetical protein GCM10009416_12520 [Craurococcus roseus]|uniref:Uncharacterized protein n=1 Tax=Craurococcus roseus TaxID=77585 RepID=A0ABP3PTK8_9PROT
MQTARFAAPAQASRAVMKQQGADFADPPLAHTDRGGVTGGDGDQDLRSARHRPRAATRMAWPGRRRTPLARAGDRPRASVQRAGGMRAGRGRFRLEAAPVPRLEKALEP